MANAIHVWGTLAKVQSDAKHHVAVVEIDPDCWDKTPLLVESVGEEMAVDFWPPQDGERP